MELQKLKNRITQASQAYYQGTPEMSDEEFDELINKLRFIEPKDPLLLQVAFGYDPTKDTSGEKVPHKYQTVGSLDKINKETCEKYFAKKPIEQVITSKIDGLSVVCYYGVDGHLEKAVTRGDGEVGIDCTSKLRLIVPKHISLRYGDMGVRGEVTIDKEQFAEFYPDAASPRNTAGGILGKDKPTTEEVKRLTFVAYDVLSIDATLFETKSEMLGWLYEQGFTTTTYTKLSGNRSGEWLEALKGSLDPNLPSDGLVITNEYNPQDQIAYKFEAETAETTVTDVTWEASRLGNIIPVVHFNPVKLSGATLGKCSGFNAQWILDNKVGPGSKIVIHRAGEVIPYIKSILTEAFCINQNNWPNKCPSCQERTFWKGVHIYCQNENCPARVEGKILHWLNTLARIDSLGENILIPLIDYMGWEGILHIYETPTKIWIKAQANVTNHASKLIEQLYDKLFRDPVDPDLFLAAFGLPAVGETVSKMISKEMGLEQFFVTPYLLPCLGSWCFSRTITAPAVKSLIDHYDQMYEIYSAICNGQGFIQKKQSASMRVCITGKLSKPRKELAEEFAAKGIEVVESMSKDVSFLITDDPTSGSSKNERAVKLGIKVISEENFRKEKGI